MRGKSVYYVKYKNDDALAIYGDECADIKSDKEFRAFVARHRDVIASATIINTIGEYYIHEA